MLPRADITGTRPVTLIEASTPANSVGQAKQESLDRLTQLTLGKEYQIQVLTRLANGSFLVRIGDAAANMSLPTNTKAGDVLEMTLISNQPRATFLLGKTDAAATMSLSNAGRLISRLLQQVQDGHTPTGIIGKTPLLAAQGASAQHIAGALQNALSFSGLFYESHVAQWAQGTRPASDLLNEPPAKRTAGNEQAAPQENEATTQGKLIGIVREWIGNDRTTPDLFRSAATHMRDSTLADLADPLADKQQTMPAREAIRLISAQLDTLEQRRVLWQGELFPGQPFEWEIADDTPQHQHDGQPETQTAWQSTVRFSLPTLGMVAATIRLNGAHVQVQVNTTSLETAATLKNHGQMLIEALDAAGTTLDSLLVKQDG